MIVGFRPSMLGPVDVTAGKSSALNATLALARPGESARFGAFRRAGGGQPRPGERAGQGRRFGQYAQQARGNPGGQINPQANLQGRMSQGGAGDLNEVLAGTGEGEAAGGLRFSDESGGVSQTGQSGSGVAGDLAGAAGASNSFLLTGNVVDATAPPMRRGRRGRFFRFGFGGGPGGPG